MVALLSFVRRRSSREKVPLLRSKDSKGRRRNRITACISLRSTGLNKGVNSSGPLNSLVPWTAFELIPLLQSETVHIFVDKLDKLLILACKIRELWLEQGSQMSFLKDCPFFGPILFYFLKFSLNPFFSHFLLLKTSTIT